MEQSPIIDIEVKAVHWLRGFPSTVIVDRLEFRLNHVDFQGRINEQVARWPILELPKQNRMFVIRLKSGWHRAVIKFFNERTNKYVLQLTDSSKTIDFRRNRFEMRSIEDSRISDEPWGRFKCYLFGIQFQKPPFSARMVDMFDSFFANCQLRAVMLPIEQHSEYMRKTFLCDFIKNTPNGPQSFRELVLNAGYATLEHKDKPVNIRLNGFVQNILAQNISYELDPKLCSTIKLRQCSTLSSTSTLRPSTLKEILQAPSTELESTLIKTERLAAPSTQHELDCTNFSNITINEIIKSPEIEEHIIISKEKKIGSGSFGIVFEGTLIVTKTQVALKKIVVPLSEMSLNRTTIVSEVNILRTLDHENIISLKGVYVDIKNCTSSMDIYLCFDLAVTDLAKYIDAGSSLSHGMIMSATQKILHGMSYMHRKGIVHRDVKPSNMLVFSNGNVQLCDFGLAIAKTDPDWANRDTGLGTREYMAPEMLLESYEYDCAVDMWGVGCCVVEMAKGSILWGRDKRVWDDQLNYIFSIFGTPSYNEWPEIYEYCPKLKRRPGKGIRNVLSGHPELFQLVEGLLQLNPSKRYTARNALDDTFFWLTPEEVLT